MSTARKTYRKHVQRRRAIFSLILLLPFCIVFLVEMSCLIGKLPNTKSNCLETNLCQGHPKPAASPLENPKPKQVPEDGHKDGSHDHSGHKHGHPKAVSDNEHGNEPVSSQLPSHPSCKGHDGHNLEQEVAEFVEGRDKGITSLENCCIDDSVRFFSTPAYFHSNDASFSFPISLVLVCELPRAMGISFEEKTVSFKPPENETLPPFSRLERFQMFLI